MREIKFRAWDTKNNSWLHGYSEQKNGCDILGETILLGGWMSEVSVKDLNNILVDEYTGLKDNNGKEIYEGDIVEFKNQNRIFKIEYDAPSFWAICISDLTFSKSLVAENLGEIIGNIHENPELLK